MADHAPASLLKADDAPPTRPAVKTRGRGGGPLEVTGPSRAMIDARCPANKKRRRGDEGLQGGATVRFDFDDEARISALAREGGDFVTELGGLGDLFEPMATHEA